MDLVNQSIPFSYVGLSVSPNDSGSHSVQIYADISGEWLGGTSLPMEWSATADTSITYQLKLQTQTMITETKNRAAYGSMFFSTPKITGTTYQTAPDVVTRAAFIANGTLPNTQNNTFRAIGLEWPVFAFAHDLGTIDWKSSGSALFSLGYVRDPVVQYMTAQGPQNRSPLYLTRFTQMKDLVRISPAFRVHPGVLIFRVFRLQLSLLIIQMHWQGLISLTQRLIPTPQLLSTRTPQHPTMRVWFHFLSDN